MRALKAYGQELDIAHHALVGKLQCAEKILFLLRGVIPAVVYIPHGVNDRPPAARYYCCVKAVGSNGKYGTVKRDRLMDLVPAKTYSRHDVCGGVRLGEHVFYLTQ